MLEDTVTGHNSITLKLGHAMETSKDCLNINAYRAEPL